MARGGHNAEVTAIRIWMPDCGEAGVIIATRDDGARVEFRGEPYSLWKEGDQSPMIALHSLLKTVNISQLHCGEIETLTPWNIEWGAILALFESALSGSSTSEADGR